MQVLFINKSEQLEQCQIKQFAVLLHYHLSFLCFPISIQPEKEEQKDVYKNHQ